MNSVRLNKIISVFFSLVIVLGSYHSLNAENVAQDSSVIVDINKAVQDTGSIIPLAASPTYFQKLLADTYLPVFLLIMVVLVILRYVVKMTTSSYDSYTEDENAPVNNIDLNEYKGYSKATVNSLNYIIPVLSVCYLVYVGVKGTMMQGYTMEWLNLLIRWAHVVAGIMWIGASFYFVFLENNLNLTHKVRDELAGNIWSVHGGGFYFLEKYKVAPKVIPNDLHWFKYEAYFTFITGFALLVVVYYMNANSFMIDPSVADISVGMAIAISIACIVFGWVIYDLLCKSPMMRRPAAFVIIGIILLTGLAYFLTHIFNSRAAFIHFGAVIGAIMVGNVFFNIIPAQKAMVKAAKMNLQLDASLGQKAGQRSLHNNYFTLPVIYVMISNHFPSTFGHEYNWIILIVISVASAGVKHYWNLLERGQINSKLLIISLVALFSLAIVISPAFEARLDLAIPVSFQEAKKVIDDHCIQCHSASPTDEVWKAAPNGVMYDTPEQVKNMSDKIMARAVRTKTMPQGNKTNMTDEERTILKRWILQGAKIDEIR